MAHVQFSSGPVAPCSTAIDEGYPPAVGSGKPRDSRITHAEMERRMPPAARHTNRLPAIVKAAWVAQMVAKGAARNGFPEGTERLDGPFNLCSYLCRSWC